MIDSNQYLKGRGSQINPKNPYLKNEYVQEFIEGIDEPFLNDSRTEFYNETPKNIVNKVDSPDIGLMYSMNPYQGCEHGCVYCYARNSHQYWGFSAGVDFEQKVIIKKNAAELLEKFFINPKWNPQPIMLSGNTDCYQPAERKLKITRSILEVFLKFRNPVSIITKNALVLRDIDILAELTKYNLVTVNITITTLDETLRLNLEPRTASSVKRLKVVNELSKHNIPVNVMVAPIIPGLNDHEIPSIIKESSIMGASSAAFTIVRLNGAVKDIFQDWIRKCYPMKADKVLHHIAECHGGKLNDSRVGVRLKGEGPIAETIANLFKLSVRKYMKDKGIMPLNRSAFLRLQKGQLNLFT